MHNPVADAVFFANLTHVQCSFGRSRRLNTMFVSQPFYRAERNLKSDGFFHDAKRNPCMLVVSWRLAMNFAREPFFAAPRRKSGNRRRSALATTNSDGGMPGRTVRSHDPNESHTSLGATTARYWSRPWVTVPA